MTHLFYVHSAITEKVAQAIIREEDIQELAFVSPSRYDPKSDRKLDSKTEDIYEIKGTRFNVFKNWWPIWRGDRRIDKLLGDQYHLYVPQTAMHRIQLLMSHPSCEGFSIMEEGLSSYYSKSQRVKAYPPPKRSLRRYIAYLGRLGTGEFIQEGYRKVYAIREEAFPEIDSKHIVDLQFDDENYSSAIKNTDCIVVCESLTFYDQETSCVYVSSLTRALQIINARYDVVHYKLHPDNYNTWQESFLKNLIDTFCEEAREIDRASYIEEVAVQTGADIIVNISATGLYCGMFADGCVYSFADIFKQIGKDIVSLTEIENAPPMYWRRVRQLNGTENHESSNQEDAVWE